MYLFVQKEGEHTSERASEREREIEREGGREGERESEGGRERGCSGGDRGEMGWEEGGGRDHPCCWGSSLVEGRAWSLQLSRPHRACGVCGLAAGGAGRGGAGPRGRGEGRAWICGERTLGLRRAAVRPPWWQPPPPPPPPPRVKIVQWSGARALRARQRSLRVKDCQENCRRCSAGHPSPARTHRWTHLQ